MDKAIAIFILLVVLVVGTVLIAPSYIDWNQYRDQIEAYGERITGRDVSIDGDIGFVLLPTPALTISDFSVANSEDASEGPMLSLKRLEMQAALRPLLMGDIEITNVRLINPQIALEILAGNSTNWRFEGADAARQMPDIELPSWLSAVARALRLDNISIKDGTLTYIDPARGVRQLVENLNGNFSAATLKGPFTAQGTALLRGVDVEFEWSIADTSRMRAVPVRFNLTFPRSDSEIAFRGFLEEATLFGPIRGDLSFAGSDAARGLNDLFSLIRGGAVAPPKGQVGKALAQDFRAEADFTINGRSLSADNLVVGLGGVRARGKMTVQMGRQPQFALTLGARSLNLDALLEQAHTVQKSVNLEKASSAIQSELEGFLLPTNLRGTIDIKIDGVIFRAGVIQDFVIKAHAEDGKIKVDHATGRLPGRAQFSGSGSWIPVLGGTRFDGAVTLKAENPQGLLRWAGFDMSTVRPDRLFELAFDGRITAGPDNIEIFDVHVQLDGEEHEGGFNYMGGERPAYRLTLRSGTLDLDAYGSLVPLDDVDMNWPIEDGDGGYAWAPQLLDLDLELAIDRLVWRGQVIDGVDVDLTVREGVLSIERFNLSDLAGVRLALSGDLQGTFWQPNIAVETSAEASNMAALLGFLGVGSDWVPADSGRTRVGLTGDMTPDGGRLVLYVESVNGRGERVRLEGALERADGQYVLTLNSVGEAAGDIRITGSGNATPEDFDFLANVSITAEETSAFLRRFGVGYKPAAGDLGPLNIRTEINIDDGNVELRSFSARVGESRIEATGILNRDGDLPMLTGEISLSNIALDRFMPAQERREIAVDLATQADLQALAAELLSFDLRADPHVGEWLVDYGAQVSLVGTNVTLGGVPIDRLKATITLAQGSFTTSDIEGEVFDGTLNGSLDYSASDLLPELSGQLTLRNAHWAPVTSALLGLPQEFAPLNGRVDMSLDFSALGRTGGRLLSTLNGPLTIAAGQGTFRGFDVALFFAQLEQASSLEEYAQLVERTMTQGATPYESLYGVLSLEDGRILSPGNGEKNEPLLAILSTGAAISEASPGAMTIRGEIDLTTHFVNGEGSIIFANYEDSPPLKIRLTGALNAPRRQIESASLGAYFVDDFAARADNIAKSEADRQIEMFRTAIERLDDTSGMAQSSDPAP